MKVAVWDTYVKRADGKTMHFDILVDSELKDEEVIHEFGRKYLAEKPFKTGQLSTSECRFCHIEQATEEMSRLIQEQGYSIIEMENCN